MRIDNVFFGFTKKGERRLLWKRFRTEVTDVGDVARTMYYDLERKEWLDSCEVDESSLVPVTYLVGSCTRMSRRRVVKCFRKDNNMEFDVNGIFYGNVINKTTYKQFLKDYKMLNENDSVKNSRKVNVPIIKNTLFARISDPECRVQNVKTNTLLPWYDRVASGKCVEEIRSIKKEAFEDVIVTKKKLLEADYKKVL